MFLGIKPGTALWEDGVLAPSAIALLQPADRLDRDQKVNLLPGLCQEILQNFGVC